MKKISRPSAFVVLFFISAVMVSCSAPIKTANPRVERSGDNIKKEPLTAQNHPVIHQRIEQRLDEIETSLRRIEQVVGLNPAQEPASTSNSEDLSSDSNSTDILPEDSGENSELGGSIQKNGVYEANLFTEEPSDKVSSFNKSPKVLYNKAQALLLERQFNSAEKLFKSIVDKYPDHPLAVNALYWMGECRYSVKDYKGSIILFKQLVEKYPDGRKVPDALLKTAYGYLSINDIDNGREYLKKVVRQFPFSPAGDKAERKLKSLR